MSTQPTDDEIDELWRFEASKNWDSTLAMRTNFTREALARWGQQQVPAGYALVPVEPTPEMVDAAQEAYMPFGDMQLAIQLAIAAAPQPVAREPLTDEHIKALMQARRTAMLMTCEARVPECGEFSAIAQDLDWICESFGIKGGQHGADT